MTRGGEATAHVVQHPSVLQITHLPGFIPFIFAAQAVQITATCLLPAIIKMNYKEVPCLWGTNGQILCCAHQYRPYYNFIGITVL